MTPSPNRARDLFVAAVRLDPNQWEAFLAAECGSDDALGGRVRELLAAHRAAGSFLHPAAALAATTDEPGAERPGAVIGPYKLLEPIGEGGFGVVFLAEQTEPVRRKVAVKVLKPGMDSRQGVARFEAERQALALMDHPNIAKVFDGGTTPSGRLYFVMELVNGVPVTRFCDHQKLAPRERLGLFVQVCRAVQHAHQKGVIHRDLKPSNVLATLHDGTPVVKVIDFGVAKAVGQELTDKTLFTGFAQMVGTPLYMSPEQAGMSGLDVDTRSDVYSLGVLLYELLTGTTPFRKERFERAAYDEIRRIIREEDPPKPSTRLSESRDALPAVAARRQTEPARLAKLVRGDLDWIVMRCLEKDRARRYDTAAALALDVQRYLAGESVSAVPPSTAYRLRKFARRNRSGLAAAGAALSVLVLLGGLGGWAWRDRAARHAERADHLERAVERAELLHREGRRGETLAALERARLLAREAGPPPPLAARIDSLGHVLEAEGRDEAFVTRFEAIRRDEQTEVVFEKSEFNDDKGYPKIREALEQYGLAVGVTPPAAAASHLRARPADVQAAIVAALDECLRFVYLDDSDTRPWLVEVLHLADGDPWRNRVRLAWRQPAELEGLVKDVDPRRQPPSFLLRAVRALPEPAPARLELARRVQFAYPGDFWANHHLAIELRRAGRQTEAVRYYMAALALSPDNPGVLVNRASALREAGDVAGAVADARRAIAVAPRYAAAHVELGDALYAQSKLTDAVAAYRQATEIDPRFIRAHVRLGIALFRQKKLPEAAAAYRAAIALDPTHAPAHSNLGIVFADQQQWPEAMACYRKAADLDPTYALPHANLGNALRAQNKTAEAILAYRTALGRDPTCAPAHRGLGAALRGQGHWPAAAAAYRKAIQYDPRNVSSYFHLGVALHRQRKLPDAVLAFSRALELDPGYVDVYMRLGALLADDLQDYEQASACFRKAAELAPGSAPAHAGLGNALRAQNKMAEAAGAYRAALGCDPKHVPAQYHLGTALEKQGKPDEAAAAYASTLRLQADHQPAQDGLGQVAWQLAAGPGPRARDPKRAAGLARPVLALDPKPEWVAAYAPVLLVADDAAAYRQACARVLGRLGGTTDPRVAYLVARIGGLAPDPAPDPARLVDLAGRAVRAEPVPHYLHALGLAHYRAGQFDRAIDRLTESVDGNWNANVVNWLVLAMAHHRLGRADEARTWFDKAAKWIDPAWSKEPGAGLRLLHRHDLAACVVLRREAEALLGPRPGPPASGGKK